MHTAYERSDNKSPADITALAISRDHRSVLVGDAIGRVFVWSVPSDNSRGGMTDQWVKDEGATNCAADSCGTRFSLTERKHHCRNCGKVFCSKWVDFEFSLKLRTWFIIYTLIELTFSSWLKLFSSCIHTHWSVVFLKFHLNWYVVGKKNIINAMF